MKTAAATDSVVAPTTLGSQAADVEHRDDVVPSLLQPFVSLPDAVTAVSEQGVAWPSFFDKERNALFCLPPSVLLATSKEELVMLLEVAELRHVSSLWLVLSKERPAFQEELQTLSFLGFSLSSMHLDANVSDAVVLHYEVESGSDSDFSC